MLNILFNQNKIVFLHANQTNIINFKQYSVVDLPRPAMCADRFEGIISGGMGWSGKADYDFACKLLNSMYLTKNEEGIDEICISDKDIAERVVEVNNHLNELTHKDEDTYMMNLLADIVRLMIDENIIIYDDLYRLTEPQMIKIIEDHLYIPELKDYYEVFTTVRDPIITSTIEVKKRILNPLVNGKRLY